MDLQLNGKVALVLASSSGLGKGVAMELAREGALVTLFSTKEDKLQQAQAQIKAETGQEPAYVVGSVANREDLARAVSQTVARFGSLDVLVTNAPGPKGGPFASLLEEDWDSAYNLNLKAHVAAIRQALPHMEKQGFGRILCITSSSVKQAIDNLMLSNAFRLATVGMAKTLAREVAQKGILVNVIGSGSMETPRIEALDTQNAAKAGVSLEEWQSQQAKKIPLGRYGQPAEFGRLAAFLCSGANTYLTGQAIVIDGGVTTAY